jgi:glycosyltransferase involved in cell wall biosynthesis
MIILHTEASRGWGGQELRIISEIRAMRARGHQVFLAAAPESELVKRLAGTPDAPITFPFAGKFDRTTIKGLRAFMAKEGVQVINSHSSIDGWNDAIACRTMPQVRFVRTRHLSIPVHRNWPTRWVYSRPHALVTTGEALREKLISINHQPPHKVLSIATGVDLTRFDPTAYDRQKVRKEFGISDDQLFIGMIAMMRGMKGHTVLMQALPKITTAVPNARFIIVGGVMDDNPMPQQLRDEVARMGLSDRVHFAGLRQDIPDILAALDLKVLPSVSDEGVPQSLTQALAMGVPVVSTTVGAIGEVVEENVTGRQVEPHDVAGFANAVIAQLTDRVTAQRLAVAGQERVRKFYSVESMTRRTEALYQRLLNNQPAWPETNI